MIPNGPPRDTSKDAETIELLKVRFRAQANAQAESKSPEEGGYLSTAHDYQTPDGERFRVEHVAPTWGKILRSQVVFTEVGPRARTYVLPLSKWMSLGFEPILDAFDIHDFRDNLTRKLGRDMHSVCIDARKLLGVDTSDEHSAPLGIVPALLDAVVAAIGGNRDEVLTLAVDSLATSRP